MKNKFIFLLLGVTGLTLILLGLWIADVSVGAMICGLTETNGWTTFTSVQHYHIGLWMVIFGAFFFVMDIIWIATIKKEEL